MTKLPKNISLIDAARLLNTPVGVIARDMGVAPTRTTCGFNFTGNEMLITTELLDRYKCPPHLFADFISGADRALTKAQAANMLGIRPHSLNVYHVVRATVVPVLSYGDGCYRGFRYSRKAVESHLALEAVQGVKRNSRAKPRKRTVNRPMPVQAMQNETQPIPA